MRTCRDKRSERAGRRRGVSAVGVAMFLGCEKTLVKNPSEGVGPYRSLRGEQCGSPSVLRFQTTAALKLDFCKSRSKEDAMVAQRKQMTTTSKQKELGFHCMHTSISRLEADLTEAALRSSHITPAFSPRPLQDSPKDSGKVKSDSF